MLEVFGRRPLNWMLGRDLDDDTLEALVGVPPTVVESITTIATALGRVANSIERQFATADVLSSWVPDLGMSRASYFRYASGGAHPTRLRQRTTR